MIALRSYLRFCMRDPNFQDILIEFFASSLILVRRTFSSLEAGIKMFKFMTSGRKDLWHLYLDL